MQNRIPEGPEAPAEGGHCDKPQKQFITLEKIFWGWLIGEMGTAALVDDSSACKLAHSLF